MPAYTIVGTNLERGPVVEYLDAASPQAAEIAAFEPFDYVAAVVQGHPEVDDPRVYSDEQTWTVLGFDPESGQRISEAVRAVSTKEAEQLVSFGKPSFLASGVLRGLKTVAGDYAVGKPSWAERDFSLRQLERAREQERGEPYGQEPRFRHDCDECEFVGHYLGADVWLPAHEGNSSIIVRHSSVGEDYESGYEIYLGDEALHAADVVFIRAEIERHLFEPTVLAALAQGQGHPAPRARLSPLAAPATPVPAIDPTSEPTLER